ncbi:ATP phosphoribosyltransferase regulatory subunit [Tanticharoenia sakaeratensis]|uniref:ATP phosphoribosyltransferase regulatory subunit n=1 Tax=Tanticharoenia sakaeratensis NBRC 103193 TaxID=1231623 RepID=A0A0D6MPZ2_9PROT|nr:ATP phosphoribosyltransferase regulatory subunit [Tanticharoenia sakaeratensis]GAN55521.1 histidyl-tRNA synthetase [Tanticharoenia sakaeratensis NBRC 103193]GBQ21843.1 histidyl-tRNA synthetase [Tanticharoenia sakaeratensis NBRC 103193]
MSPPVDISALLSGLNDEASSPALLPSGFVDLLPGEAEAEAQGIEALMGVFGAHGYERVRPPLLEFETSLLSGAGNALAEQTFRLMDPHSRRMLGLRPDMTTQIARIASTRLSRAPRPLRLSYAGACVVIGTPGRETERQISQAGIELIGPDSAQADAEVVLVAAEAMAQLGIARPSFDLTVPQLARTLLAESGLGAEACGRLAHALDRKDAAALAKGGGALSDLLIALLQAAGPADTALSALAALDLPVSLRPIVERLRTVVSVIRAHHPDLALTIDPVEFRGWHYHVGVCVTVFAPGQREELGRGGRYLVGDGEPACGLTLRPEALLRAARLPARRPRVYLAPDADRTVAARLREEGCATVAALDAVSGEAALAEQARALDCARVLLGDRIIPV